METIWSIIAETDLDSYWNAPQSAALKTGKLATPLTNAFPGVMSDVTAAIRTALASRGLVSSLAQSVPPEARTHAGYLIIEALSARLTTLKISDDQRKLIDGAHAWLKALSDPKTPVTISTPTAGMTLNVQQPRGVKQVSSRPRLFTRREMDGL